MFALFFSAFIMAGITYMNPDNYDYVSTKSSITLVENDLTGLDPKDYDEETLSAARKWIEYYGYGFSFLSKLCEVNCTLFFCSSISY